MAVTKFHTGSVEYKHPQLCAFERVGENEMLLIYQLHLLGSFKWIMTYSRDQQNPSDSLHISSREEALGEMEGSYTSLSCSHIFWNIQESQAYNLAEIILLFKTRCFSMEIT